MALFPRKIRYFPLIFLASVYQYTAALCLLWDSAAGNATALHSLVLIFQPSSFLPLVISASATIAWAGFYANRRVTTVLCLVPQQLLLFISAGGAVASILQGHFADGVIRPQAFLTADQAPEIYIAVFHTWSMFIVMKHSQE